MADQGLSIARIEALAASAKGRGLAVLALEEAGASLRIRFAPPVAGSDATSMRSAAPEPVRSPGVGRFVREHPLGGLPSPGPGERVEKGALLGFVRSAGALLPVRAPRAGRLGASLVADGEAVMFDAPLFELFD